MSDYNQMAYSTESAKLSNEYPVEVVRRERLRNQQLINATNQNV